uniref:ORF3 protein n=1 Tax=Ferret hepatitis E virus TaxID=1213422 RepID=A0A1U7ET79_9VIRU|nr:ORF3 protein [Ferret hepatitis E virus]BAX00164.1 ORF3 protein [Ferret hepatitis E virus]
MCSRCVLFSCSCFCCSCRCCSPPQCTPQVQGGDRVIGEVPGPTPSAPAPAAYPLPPPELMLGPIGCPPQTLSPLSCLACPHSGAPGQTAPVQNVNPGIPAFPMPGNRR